VVTIHGFADGGFGQTPARKAGDLVSEINWLLEVIEIKNGGRAGTRTPDFLRVTDGRRFQPFHEFVSSITVSYRLRSLLSLRSANPVVLKTWGFDTVPAHFLV
jgi:hypothetical protein